MQTPKRSINPPMDPTLARRRFLASCAALLLPRPVASLQSGVADAVIVGAGAAGLAAARTLSNAGKSAVVLEASRRIGGRSHTDTKFFGVPYDVGAHWLHNGERNPYNKFARANGFELAPAPETYRMFSSSGELDQASVDALWDTYDEILAAIGKAGRGGEDVSAEQAVRNVSGRWKNTAKFMIGPWEMGKDFENFSALDWWNSDGGPDYFCDRGYGTLVARYGAGQQVSLNTEVNKIDWRGKLVKVSTGKGTVEAKSAIVTVSTGALASGNIEFAPRLPADVQQTIESMPMGHYDHIAVKFSKDVFGVGENGYLIYEIGNDGRGFGTLANADGYGLAYCDVGGSWAKQLQHESVDYKVDYALGQLKSMLGNDVARHFEKGTATAWGLERNTFGAYASADPGAYHLRDRLRMPVAGKIYFAGEACHRSMWATVGGAHLSGVEAARSLLRSIS